MLAGWCDALPKVCFILYKGELKEKQSARALGFIHQTEQGHLVNMSIKLAQQFCIAAVKILEMFSLG